MDVREARQAALLILLDEDIGPVRGRQQRLAKRIGKSAAQVSQWLSGYRTIEEDTAREIEKATDKPPRWMDDIQKDPEITPEEIVRSLSENTVGVNLSELAKFLNRLQGLPKRTAVEAVRYVLEDPGNPQRVLEAQRQIEQLLPKPEAEKGNGTTG